MASFNQIKSQLTLDQSVSSMEEDGFEQYYPPKNQLWKIGDDFIDCFQLCDNGRVTITLTNDECLTFETPNEDFGCSIQTWYSKTTD